MLLVFEQTESGDPPRDRIQRRHLGEALSFLPRELRRHNEIGCRPEHGRVDGEGVRKHVAFGQRPPPRSPLIGLQPAVPPLLVPGPNTPYRVSFHGPGAHTPARSGGIGAHNVLGPLSVQAGPEQRQKIGC